MIRDGIINDIWLMVNWNRVCCVCVGGGGGGGNEKK